jgi:hypothetical protein
MDRCYTIVYTRPTGNETGDQKFPVVVKNEEEIFGALSHHISRKTIQKAINELESNDFVQIVTENLEVTIFHSYLYSES